MMKLIRVAWIERQGKSGNALWQYRPGVSLALNPG